MRIGDGASINIWTQPWIRDNEHRAVDDAPLEAIADLRVKDLMVPGLRCWDQILISALFPHQTASKILQIPLLEDFAEDRRIWRYSRDGEYSVKSAYRLFMDQSGNQEQYQVAGNWMTIWRLDVPHKVRVFLWRACRDCIPTRIRLQDRGISCPAICLFCQQDLENTFHYFFTCPGSISVWTSTGLWNWIEPNLTEVESFQEMIFKLSCLLD